jgi:integrase
MIEIIQGKFQRYMELNYSNQNTIRQYLSREIWFNNKFIQSNMLTQESIDKFIIWFNRKRNKNWLYTGFIKAYLDCYNTEDELRLKIPKDKSRNKYKASNYKYLDVKLLRYLIDKLLSSSMPVKRHIGVMIQIYLDTGLRATELLNLKREKGTKNPEWGWNLDSRTLWGIGKGNKPFNVLFSAETAKIFNAWLMICKDRDKPFAFYRIIRDKKRNLHIGEEIKNPYQKLHFWITKFSNEILNSDNTHPERRMTPHQIRHSLGHFLRVKGFDLPEIKTILRHADIGSTQIYAVAAEEEAREKLDKEIFGEK